MSLLSKTILPKDKPQIITTRLVAAPRELVWKALTTPEHLQHFWGPDGFTNSYRQFDLKVFWCGERLPNQFAGCRN